MPKNIHFRFRMHKNGLIVEEKTENEQDEMEAWLL